MNSASNRLLHVVTKALVMCALVSTSVGAAEAPFKVAVVNLEAVMSSSKQGKELQLRLESFSREAGTELKNLEAAARDLKARLDASNQNLSEADRSKLNSELQKEQGKIKARHAELTREGEALKGKGLQEIEKSFEPIFKRIRDENGYDLILNNTGGIVLMFSKRVDITELVIKRLNEAHRSRSQLKK